MSTAPALDHIALTVPDLQGLVDRLTGDFGMVAQVRSDHFALVTDPASGLSLELSPSADAQAHFRHLGFRADDVAATHETLVAAGMEDAVAPHRRDIARMVTSFLKASGGFEIQLVRYD
ncbi:VOC family protein [Phenylobacterium sp.]|uniref:VOC family protein n=1 Tax=Phenylobacterium sp. TaxID=1871053 RepID=UPI003BAB2D44